MPDTRETIKSLIDKRAAAWAQMREITARAQADKDRDFTPEERQAWDRAEADITALTGDIDRHERGLELDARFRKVDDEKVIRTPDGDPADKRSAEKYRAAYRSWMRAGMDGCDNEQRQMLVANMVTPDTRAAGTVTGAGGGYTVPDEFWAKITEAKKLFSVIGNEAEQMNTGTGAQLPWPTNDDTSNEGEIIGENTAANEQDLSFGQKVLGAHLYSSKMIRVSFALLNDSAIDIEAFVSRKVGERLGRVQQKHFTIGIGAPAQPQGLVANATVGKTTASATAITWAELVDLQHSVDAAYRGPNAAWTFNDLVLAYIRKLTDSQGLPIWQPSLQVGVPSTLMGQRYLINNYMDSTVTTGKRTVGFGDIRQAFVVRTVAGGYMQRLTERYAEYGQVAFLGFDRADSLIQDAGAFKVMAQA